MLPGALSSEFLVYKHVNVYEFDVKHGFPSDIEFRKNTLLFLQYPFCFIKLHTKVSVNLLFFNFIRIRIFYFNLMFFVTGSHLTFFYSVNEECTVFKKQSIEYECVLLAEKLLFSHCKTNSCQ